MSLCSVRRLVFDRVYYAILVSQECTVGKKRETCRYIEKGNILPSYFVVYCIRRARIQADSTTYI